MLVTSKIYLNLKDDFLKFRALARAPKGATLSQRWGLLWREIKTEHNEPVKFAYATFLGIFIGCSPFFGLHLPIGLLVASAFKLNKLVTGLWTNISIPPIAALLLIANYQTGHLLVHGELFSGNLSSFSLSSHLSFWLIGWPIVGTIAGISGALPTYWLTRRYQQNGPAPKAP